MAPVWAKFLAAIALLAGLTLTAVVTVGLWSAELISLAFVPRAPFVAPPPLPATAYMPDTLWLARPDARGNRREDDTSGMIPEGWRDSPAPPSHAAVFFVPTTTSFASRHWNDSLVARDGRARDRLFLGLLSSPFNRSQIWAPLYRQVVIGAFLNPSPSTRAAIDVAYGDVRLAFDTFMAAQPRDRPIVLAGHGQGALLLLRLLRERVAGQPLANRIVAVYAIGWPIALHAREALPAVPACSSPDETGCLMGWISFAEPADPGQLVQSARNAPLADGNTGQPPYLCTNPLNGGAARIAPASANLGALIPNPAMVGGSIAKGLVPAGCNAQGLLIIGKPIEMGGYVLPGNNYTAYDIPLFWANLRADVARREVAWVARHNHLPQAPASGAPHD